MITSVLLDHEPVADGGFFTRAVLLIEGAATRPRVDVPAVPGGLAATARRLAARNVQVAVRPGKDAEFIQMRHPFESRGSGPLLTILVGDVYSLDQIRIRMDALVGPGAIAGGEADVGELVVLAHVPTEDGGMELQTVSLPIRVSLARGGLVEPDIRRMPISGAGASVRRLYTFRSYDEGEAPPQCA